jgi:hypothetical protein
VIGLVVATVLATGVVTVPLTYLVARRPKPTMPHRRQALLDEAMALLFRLLNTTDPDRFDMLSDQSKQAADRLLTRYNKEIDK